MSASAPHFYDAFGLSIASDFPLHELRPAPLCDVPDLTILNRPIGCSLPKRENGPLMDYTNPDGVIMAWPEVAGFRFVDDSTIFAQKHADTTDRMLAFPLLGPVMAWALNARKMNVLHASAVNVGGRTIGFLGDKLAGKSTTAAAFIRAGHALVTDDLLVITIEGDNQPQCHPAFPQVKLDDKAAQAIPLKGAKAQPLVMEGFPKRQHALGAMHTGATSLDCLVQLERGGDAPHFTPYAARHAIEAIARFGYMPRFANAPWTHADKKRHFTQCVRIADRVLSGRLHVPDDLTRLDETVQFVADMLDRQPT